LSRHSAFRFGSLPALGSGQLRLTRLNIYSGLYLEWGGIKILVDPAKIVPELVPSLEPDIILVSHESMDHFEADLCLRFLGNGRTVLLGSQGTLAALAGALPAEDTRWQRILTAVPGSAFVCGGLRVDVHASLHCEYAVPLFFELTDLDSGWRLIDLIDTARTPELEAGRVRAGCDLLIVPLGIALGANAATAWELVELLRPRAIMPGHFNGDPGPFVARASAEYGPDRIFVCDWHEGITLSGAGSPVAQPPVVAAANEPTPASELYADAIALLKGGSIAERRRVHQRDDAVLDGEDERLAAAYLLARGVLLGKSSDGHSEEIEELMDRLDPSRPYLAYWILECCGRAAENPRHRATVRSEVDGVVNDPKLFGCEPIRRKLMWEVFRLVSFGERWPGLAAALARAHRDPNPDVRLLAFKTLPLCYSHVPGWQNLLEAGLDDRHEDVVEWVVRACIDLHEEIADGTARTLRDALPRLLTYPNYHVRLQASALAEIAGAQHDRAARA
jgi:L-ascorbate metabolism protein UlaG (beta-lactamase superfamily)